MRSSTPRHGDGRVVVMSAMGPGPPGGAARSRLPGASSMTDRRSPAAALADRDVGAAGERDGSDAEDTHAGRRGPRPRRPVAIASPRRDKRPITGQDAGA